MSNDDVRLNVETFRWSAAALVVAVAGALGSVYLSVGMGLKACPLCFYQRTFVLSVAAVLIVGLARHRNRADLLALVCLPLAVGGLAIAAFHVWLELSGKLECPQALLGWGTAPQQSLALFCLLTPLLAVAARRDLVTAVGGVLVGLGLAWACVASAPAMPPAPTKAYEQPPEICRPPFVGRTAE